MKNSKKTWGILGTSMGSMLIIVALLTMVGMGSNDTYAVCSCPSDYTYNATTNQCTKTIRKDVACSASAKNAKCTETDDGSEQCICNVEKTLTQACTGSEAKTCADGRYDTGSGLCYPCPAGSYCTGGKAHTCPAGTTSSAGAGSESDCKKTEAGDRPLTCGSNQYVQANHCAACPVKATCNGQTFTCEKGYKPSGNACVSDGNPPDDPTDYEKSECETVGGPCTIHGRTGTCTLTGGKKLCKLNSPSGEDGDSSCSKANETCTLNGKSGKCIASGSGFTCQITTSPSGGDDDSGKNIGNCPAGTYYLGLNHAADCPSGYYCPGGTYNANTGDVISGCEKIACPANATCTSSSYTCNKGYHPSSGGCVKDGTSGGDDGSGGNGGGGNSGGNSGGNGNGGNTGGNGNGGNAGGNNGNNNGGNNAAKNPNTATKAPLVIAIIGIISVGISSVVYFKGKKEINTEI